MVASGSLLLGLSDLRADSLSKGVSETIELKPLVQAILIPPGVGHGLYFPEPATLVQAVSHNWSMDDELGCRWDDPDLDLDWTCEDPLMSDQDRNAGTFAALRESVRIGMAVASSNRLSDALIRLR